MKFETTDIPGWMSAVELKYLELLASYVPSNGQILEIGSFCGRSTQALFNGKPDSAQLTIVDKFELGPLYNTEIQPHNLDCDKDLYKQVLDIAKKSNSWHDAFKFCLGDETYNQLYVHVKDHNNFTTQTKFDMVFVDGGHTQQEVENDAGKYINDTTLIIGDDFNYRHPGVGAALAGLRGPYGVEGRTLIAPKNSALWILIPPAGYWNTKFKDIAGMFV